MTDDKPEVRCSKNHLQTSKTSRMVSRPDGSRYRRCLICKAENQHRYDEARRFWKKEPADDEQRAK